MSLRKNLLANYGGQGWTALMGVIFIPFYLALLGIEAYGLIGVFAVLQAWLLLLDMGMSLVLNREMARHTGGAHSPQSIRTVLRTVEIVCVLVAVLIALAVERLSGWLVGNWIHAGSISVDTLLQAVAMMGVVVACRLVESLYHGAMLGLQRQVWMASAGAVLATLRWGGAAAVLAWVSNTLGAFFIWQALVSVISIATFGIALYRALPPAPKKTVKFSLASLHGLWRFSAGLVATTFFTLLLTQLDKILLLRFLSLEAFGYYTLAGALAGALLQLVVPVTQAFYPRLTELLTSGQERELCDTYHMGAQLVTVLTAPAGLVLIVFAKPVLHVWTGDAHLAAQAAPLLSLLALGTLFNCFMNMPYMLQLANGWSSLAAKTNAVAVVLLTPALFWVVPRYGSLGVASVWVALNAGYLIVGIRLMHRRLLASEGMRWYRADLVLPTLASGAVVGLAYALTPAALPRVAEGVWLVGVGLLALGAASCGASRVRAAVFAKARLMSIGTING